MEGVVPSLAYVLVIVFAGCEQNGDFQNCAIKPEEVASLEECEAKAEVLYDAVRLINEGGSKYRVPFFQHSCHTAEEWAEWTAGRPNWNKPEWAKPTRK